MVGFVVQFLRLKGGRPPPHECSLLALILQSLALICICNGPHSVSAKLILVVGTMGLRYWNALAHSLQSAMQLVIDRGPERPASWYLPPTANGEYLTDEQYELNKRIATDQQLSRLFQSPEYQKWLLDNHHRLAISDLGMRQPLFDEDGS